METRDVLPLPTDTVAVQLKNKTVWNSVRSINNADFFTIGYSGRTISEVVTLLESAGVATVIDVRYTPLSLHKPDFSKSNLVRRLGTVGISYLHAPQLGIPRDIRGLAVREQNRDVLWEWYDHHVVRVFVDRNLHFFFNAAEHPVALMCTEIDPTACHRHRLALALERSGLRGFDL